VGIKVTRKRSLKVLNISDPLYAFFFISGKVPLPTVAVDFSEARRGSRKKKKGKVTLISL